MRCILLDAASRLCTTTTIALEESINGCLRAVINSSVVAHNNLQWVVFQLSACPCDCGLNPTLVVSKHPTADERKVYLPASAAFRLLDCGCPQRRLVCGVKHTLRNHVPVCMPAVSVRN